MPPPVEAFMRHLAEYFNSQNHQAATLSSALEPKLSASTEAQKDTDRVPFSGEPYFQVESSGSASHSGLTELTLNKPKTASQSGRRGLLKSG